MWLLGARLDLYPPTGYVSPQMDDMQRLKIGIKVDKLQEQGQITRLVFVVDDSGAAMVPREHLGGKS